MELHYKVQHESVLSAVLKKQLKLSTGLMNRLKWRSAILVNGKPEHTNYLVRPGDLVTVLLDEQTPAYPAEDGELTILYEDDYILAVDKPVGMLVHPSRSCNCGTLANLVAGYYRRTGQSSLFHPLTRLDRDTFGVVVLAKNSHIHNLLQGCTVQKTYHALALGGPEDDEGIIDAPIARKPLPSLLREIRQDGKPAVTRYRVLERGEKLCKLELCPITGRTHQLRLHCAHMGYPILGDPQYGTQLSAEVSREFGLYTQMLCAKRVSLVHPITGEELTIESLMDV